MPFIGRLQDTDNSIDDGTIANKELVSAEISLGGVTVSLGGTVSQPAFDLTNAINLSSGALDNSTVNYGGVTVSLGSTDPTPAFDLTDATNYQTSNLSGSITNAQLAGSIENSKLLNSSVSYGGVTVSLGGTDATPAFDLSDATNYSANALTGTTLNSGVTASSLTSLGDSVGIGTDSPTNVGLEIKTLSTDTVGTGHIGLSAGSTPLWVLRTGTSDADLNLDRYYGSWSTTPALTIKRDTGNIGIGITNPDSLLHVNGGFNNYIPTNTGTGLFKLTGGQSSAYSLYIGIDDVGGYFGHNGSSRDLFFQTNETTRMTLSSSGNLGIGETQPSSRLVVAGGASLFQDQVRSTAQIRATGWYESNTGTTGNDLGFEIGVSGGEAFALSYNRATSSYGAMNLTATDIDLQPQVGDATVAGNRILTTADSASFLSSGANDTTIGNITISKSLPKLILDSPSTGDAFTSQGAQISLGESGDGGSAALHLTYRGDGYAYIGMGALSSGIPPFSQIRFYYASNNVYIPGPLTVGDVGLTAGNHLQRSDHHSGHLEGSYNNIGANDTRSNPIYSIGSAYNPDSTTLSNFYGIGYTNTNASFITSNSGSGWGMYVASDGDARIFLNAGNGTIWSSSSLYSGGNLYYSGQTTRYLSNVTGQYGSVQVNGSGVNGWEGFSIDGRAVFMHDGSTGTGIYNDVDNEWLFYGVHNSYTRMYHNGSTCIETTASGATVYGSTILTSGSGVMFSNATTDLVMNSQSLHFGAQNTNSKIRWSGTTTLWDLISGDLVIRDNTTNRFTFNRTSGNFTANGNITGGVNTSNNHTLNGSSNQYTPYGVLSVGASTGLHLVSNLSTTFQRVTMSASASAVLGMTQYQVNNSSATGDMNYYIFNRSPTSSGAPHFIICKTGGTSGDIEFRLENRGQAYADLSWSGGGADYAEYFEWSDGNPNEEDRVGYSVVLDGDKIRLAQTGEEPFGVVSANPAVVGDSDINYKNKYLKDDFGRFIWDEHEVLEYLNGDGELENYESHRVDEIVAELGNVPETVNTLTHDENGNRFTHRRLNPDYDPTREFVPRENRPEWDTIGLVGKLRIRKGQPVGDRWIKMRDISDAVEEWLVR